MNLHADLCLRLLHCYLQLNLADLSPLEAFTPTSLWFRGSSIQPFSRVSYGRTGFLL